MTSAAASAQQRSQPTSTVANTVDGTAKSATACVTRKVKNKLHAKVAAALNSQPQFATAKLLSDLKREQIVVISADGATKLAIVFAIRKAQTPLTAKHHSLLTRQLLSVDVSVASKITAQTKALLS
jgi:hypothetical protein